MEFKNQSPEYLPVRIILHREKFYFEAHDIYNNRWLTVSRTPDTNEYTIALGITVQFDTFEQAQKEYPNVKIKNDYFIYLPT